MATGLGTGGDRNRTAAHYCGRQHPLRLRVGPSSVGRHCVPRC